MLLLLWQPAVCSSSGAGASCSKDLKDSSEEETTDEEEDSDDEQWNSEEAENDELAVCFVRLFQYKSNNFIRVWKTCLKKIKAQPCGFGFYWVYFHFFDDHC